MTVLQDMGHCLLDVCTLRSVGFDSWLWMVGTAIVPSKQQLPIIIIGLKKRHRIDKVIANAQGKKA